MALQADTTSIQARRVTALLKGLQSDDPALTQALNLLTSWNNVLTATVPPAPCTRSGS